MAAVITTASSVVCEHGGHAATDTPTARVHVDGQMVVAAGDIYLVAACPALVQGTGAGCISGQWVSGADRVRIGGRPVAVADGASITAPGAASMVVVANQSRVTAQ